MEDVARCTNVRPSNCTECNSETVSVYLSMYSFYYIMLPWDEKQTNKNSITKAVSQTLISEIKENSIPPRPLTPAAAARGKQLQAMLMMLSILYSRFRARRAERVEWCHTQVITNLDVIFPSFPMKCLLRLFFQRTLLLNIFFRYFFLKSVGYLYFSLFLDHQLTCHVNNWWKLIS